VKYVISLFLGLIVGAVLFFLGLYVNPFTGQATVSPLAVTNQRVMDLSFPGVPSEGILYTDHGESVVTPHPDRVSELWEPAVADTNVYVTALADGRGDFAGLGIKYTSKSERTALIKGEAIADSIWHIYLPGQGTLLIDQTENFWPYIREVVIPARTSSGDNWIGSFHSITTNGPGSLGTARVTGGSGLFAGLATESVEALTVRGYSSVFGPVSMEGNLTIELPKQAAATE
jgi:hypothetical protein